MDTQQADWKNAAISAGNLSDLEVTLGELLQAVQDAQLAVEYADRSGDDFEKLAGRTTVAAARHQRSRQNPGSKVSDSELARQLFETAENLQRERQPRYPLLYSWGGFRYCDLLLAPVEAAAGRMLRCRRAGAPEVRA